LMQKKLIRIIEKEVLVDPLHLEVYGKK